MNQLMIKVGYGLNGKLSFLAFDIPLKDSNLIINGLLCFAVLLMLVLLVVLIKSFKSLRETSTQKNFDSKAWITQKLYDFDAQQIKILLKKINKINKDDQ